jgi:hypothetical protein
MVLDDFGGRLGRAWPEMDEERTDREAVIADRLTGQYHDPVRIVAFNTSEGWSRDVSEDMACELLQRAASAHRDLPEAIENFVEQYAGSRPVQLPLPLPVRHVA